MLIGPSWAPNLGPIRENILILGPLGPEVDRSNFAVMVTKFVLSNSGNFRAKENPPKPRSCQMPIRAMTGAQFQCWLGSLLKSTF